MKLGKSRRLSREEAFLEFVTPGDSPVWTALAAGTSLFDRNDKHFRVLWHYAGGRSEELVFDIWSSVFVVRQVVVGSCSSSGKLELQDIAVAAQRRQPRSDQTIVGGSQGLLFRCGT